MKAYTIHAPPDDPAPERFRFVKDGIAWPALFVPLLWILWNRLWLTLVWYIVYVLVVAWIGRLAGDFNAIIVGLLGGILFALEANNIRRLSYASRGWQDLGSSAGGNLDEAEIRFFQGVDRNATAPRGAIAPIPYAGAIHAQDDEPVFGLFPEPER